MHAYVRSVRLGLLLRAAAAGKEHHQRQDHEGSEEGVLNLPMGTEMESRRLIKKPRCQEGRQGRQGESQAGKDKWPTRWGGWVSNCRHTCLCFTALCTRIMLDEVPTVGHHRNRDHRDSGPTRAPGVAQSVLYAAILPGYHCVE